MRYLLKMTATGVVALGAGACVQTSGPSEPSLSLAVAPLTLPGMTDACYGLTVYNTTSIGDFGPATQVWAQPSLCASDYGADGGIRFTGICDAQAAGASHDNAIRLVLNDIYTGGAWDGGGTALASANTLPAGDDYVNPCPAAAEGVDNGCILTAPCEENSDSKVEFNLTVMRNASLGFFDTVVKFQDIFCAAKLDCLDQDDNDLLYLPKDGVDSQTAVLAFACTGGQGAASTFLYLDDLVITCRDSSTDAVTGTATVDPTGGPGLLSAPALTQDAAILFAASVNRGDGFQNSVYWNVLLGLNGLVGSTCTLTTAGTASETDFGATFSTPVNTRYPVIEWNVDLTTDTTRACARHPLNASGDDVQTTYTPANAPRVIPHALHASAVTSLAGCLPDLPRVEQLTNEIASQTAAFDDASEAFDRTQSDYQTQIEDAQVDILNATDLIENILDPQIQQRQNQIVQLEAASQEANASYQELLGYQAFLEAGVDDFDKAYAEIAALLGGEFDGAPDAIIDAEFGGAVANEYQNALDATIGAQIDSLEQQYQEAQANLDIVEQTLDELESRLSSLNVSISDARGRLAQAEAALSLQERIRQEAVSELISAQSGKEAKQQQCDEWDSQYAVDTAGRAEESAVIRAVEEIHATQLETSGGSCFGGDVSSAPSLPSAPFVNQDALAQVINLYNQLRMDGTDCMSQRDADEAAAIQVYAERIAQLDQEFADFSNIQAVKANENTLLEAENVSLANERAGLDPDLDAQRIAEIDAIILANNATIESNTARIAALEVDKQNNRASRESETAARTEAHNTYEAGQVNNNSAVQAIDECLQLLQSLAQNSSAPSLPSAPLNDIARMLAEIRQDLTLQQHEADTAHASQQAECSDEIATYERRIQAATNTIDEAETEMTNLQSEIADLSASLASLEDQVTEVTRDIAVSTDARARLAAELMANRNEVADLQSLYQVVADKIDSAFSGWAAFFAFAGDNGVLDYLVADYTTPSRMAFNYELQAGVADDHKADAADLEKRLKQLNDELAQTEARRDETLAFINQRQRDLQIVTRNLAVLEQDFAKATKEFDQVIAELRRDLADAQSGGCADAPAAE